MSNNKKKPKNELSEERRDWCLKRAMAFYGWNKFLSHAKVEGEDEDDENDKEETSSRRRRVRGDHDLLGFNTRGKTNNTSSDLLFQQQDDQETSSIRRSTTLPLLRNCLAIDGE